MYRPLASRLLILAALACATPAAGQDVWPTRAVRVIIPLAPGAAADTIPRVIGERLAKRFGQPFVFENRPGASLNLGSEFVAKAEPDGYTLLAAPPPPVTINQHLFSNLRFDPSSFTPVSLIAAVPNVLVANVGAPFNTLAEFVAYSKANPDKTSYASAGVGATNHLAMEWLKSISGAAPAHTPYAGGLAPALNDVLAGHVTTMFNNLPNVLQLVRDRKLKALGVDSEKRAPSLPDTPAIAEAYPGFVVTTWFSFVAPPKTPPEIARRLSAAIAEEMRSPEVARMLDNLSAVPVGNSPEEFGVFLKQESERWREVVRKIGVKLD